MGFEVVSHPAYRCNVGAVAGDAGSLDVHLGTILDVAIVINDQMKVVILFLRNSEKIGDDPDVALFLTNSIEIPVLVFLRESVHNSVAWQRPNERAQVTELLDKRLRVSRFWQAAMVFLDSEGVAIRLRKVPARATVKEAEFLLLREFRYAPLVCLQHFLVFKLKAPLPAELWARLVTSTLRTLPPSPAGLAKCTGKQRGNDDACADESETLHRMASR